MPSAVSVDRWDLDQETTARIESLATGSGAAGVGRIRDDRAFTSAQVEARTVVETGGSAAADLREVWARVVRRFRLPVRLA